VKRLDAPRAVGAGAALVIAVNAFVLGASWWNRSGEPRARLDLTERELAMPLSRDRDDTGLVLTLALADRPPAEVARTALFARHPVPPLSQAWLDAAKLRGLGFDLGALEAAARDPLRSGEGEARSVRRALVVLEYDGDAWREWLAAREAEVAKLREDAAHAVKDRATLAEAEALLAIDRTSRSRLMPVDAGVDPDALRGRYPDRGRYAVVPALVVARASVTEGGVATSSGFIDRLAVERVTVPRRWLATLEPFIPKASETDLDRRLREDAAASRWPPVAPPRYRATVLYGRGLDPWLADVAPVAHPPSP
jgi:Domain of unknown function (DUF4824)